MRKVTIDVLEWTRLHLDGLSSLEVIKVSEHDYLSTITELQINAQYAAALMNGRLQLHMVVACGSYEQRIQRIHSRSKSRNDAVKNASPSCFL